MALAFVLALQAAAAPPPVIPVPFDLGALPPRQGRGGPATCGEAEGDEIVVCGRRDDERFRLRPTGRSYGSAPIRAEIGLGGGGTASVDVQSVEFPAGQISKRAMITIRWPF